nr:MAG TPA: hypothetical protein [Caudoviricetes sp.]
MLICLFVLLNSNVEKIKKKESLNENPPTQNTMYAINLAAGEKIVKSIFLEIILSGIDVQETIDRSTYILKNIVAWYNNHEKCTH